MIRLTQVFAILAGLGALSLFSGQVVSAPSGLPQTMVPAYMPASPAQGVARFRPHYRMPAPVRSMPPGYASPRGIAPGQYRPVRRAMAWPLPVSYRPIARMHRPPVNPYYRPRPYARHGHVPAAVRGYPVRPVARMVNRYPYAQRPMARPGPFPVFNGYRGYRPPMPVNYRPAPRWAPVRSAMYAPVYGSPQLYRGRVMPQHHQPMPKRLARYQPYFPRPGVPRNYHFRPAQPPVMNAPRVGLQPQPLRRGYPMGYRYRPEPRYPVGARPMVSGRSSGDAAYQANNAIAWADAPYAGRY